VQILGVRGLKQKSKKIVLYTAYEELMDKNGYIPSRNKKEAM